MLGNRYDLPLQLRQEGMKTYNQGARQRERQVLWILDSSILCRMYCQDYHGPNEMLQCIVRMVEDTLPRGFVSIDMYQAGYRFGLMFLS